MTEPDDPQVKQLSLLALGGMLVLLLLVVALERGYVHSVRGQIADVHWTAPWEELAERREQNELILTTGECPPDSELCRIPIDDAMNLLVRDPNRLYPWAPDEAQAGGEP